MAGFRHSQKARVDDRSLAVSSRTEIQASRRNLLALSRLLCEPMARLPVLRPRQVVLSARRRFPISAILELKPICPLNSSHPRTQADLSLVSFRICNDAFCVPLRVAGNPAQWMRLDTGCDVAMEWVMSKAEKRPTGEHSIGLSGKSPRYLRAARQAMLQRGHFGCSHGADLPRRSRFAR